MKLLYPLEGIGTKPGIYLTQKFGEHAPEAPPYGGNGLHNGIDWGAPKGTPIRAAHDGEAKYLIDPNGFGNHVKIYGEGMTVYGHMSSFEGRDRHVKAGEIIGYVGSTGYSTGNHLHFGYRPNGANQNDGFFGYADPSPYLTNNLETMQLIKDNGTVYLVAGVNQKVKTGIASPEALALFGDEPVSEGDTSAIPESQTLASGFIIHKK